MKALAGAVLASVVCAVALSAGAAPARQACNVRVDITDSDPKGANVRSSPGGPVIATLKNPGEGWIEVHVTAQFGDWYEIDRATLLDTMLPTGRKVILNRTGYIHRRELGVSGMENGAPVFADHNTGSRPVIEHAGGDQPVDLLGCWGGFLKVRLQGIDGWTQGACTNMNTTCA